MQKTKIKVEKTFARKESIDTHAIKNIPCLTITKNQLFSKNQTVFQE